MFFRNIFGFLGPQLAKVLSSSQYFFANSLNNRIVPCYDFLKSLLLDDKKVARSLMRGSFIFQKDVHQYLGPNLETLQQMGAPYSAISYGLTEYPDMFDKNCHQFRAAVEKAVEMGFKPSRISFIHVIRAKFIMSTSTWENKVKVYKSWKWSDDDISSAFRKHPICTLLSEKKISSAMDFLVNKMGFLPTTIAKSPVILCYSLEKRIVPRSKVYRNIQLKGLMEKDLSLRAFMKPAEKQFLDKFVTPYIEHVPELLNVYQGKVGFLPSTIAKTLTVLCFSFEKRIAPRNTIYRILQLKGLMEKEISLNTLMNSAEKQFLDKFGSP